MSDGRITRYNEQKGFGFIARSDGEDLFFHVNDCQDFQPAKGMEVRFEVGSGKKGPAAKQVRALGPAGSRRSRGDGPRGSGGGTGGGGENRGESTARGDDANAYLLPQDTARVVDRVIDSEGRRNPSLVLDRCPTQQHLEKQEHQKPHLERLRRIASEAWDKDTYQALLAHLEGGIRPILNTAKSRIAVHLSRAGGLENANCCLHPVHGIAYLPGSGLKGLAHAYACHLFHCKNVAREEHGHAEAPSETGAWCDDDEKESYIRTVEDIFGWAPNRERTGKTDLWSPRAGRDAETATDDGHNDDAGRLAAGAPGRAAAQQGLVAFHDAFGEDPQTGGPPALDIDVLTCHYGDYYSKGAAPGDWLSPVPVTFLTIAAGTRFRFRVSKASSACSENLLLVAKRLLLGGLHWLGAGAKTAAGYGWFDDRWELSDEERQARAKERRRQEEQAAAEAAAAAERQLDALFEEIGEGRALWVARQDNAKVGYRLIRGEDGSWAWQDGWEFSKKHKPNATAKQIVVAELHPEVAHRLMNPDLDRAAGIALPAGRP